MNIEAINVAKAAIKQESQPISHRISVHNGRQKDQMKGTAFKYGELVVLGYDNTLY